MSDEDERRDGIALMADLILALFLGAVFGALGLILWPLLRWVML